MGFEKNLQIQQRTLKTLNLVKVLKRKTTKNPVPPKSIEKKNINEPKDNSEGASPCQSFGKRANKNSGYQYI